MCIRDRSSALVLNALGVALHGATNFDEALTRFEQALAIDDRNVEAYINSANSLRKAGRLVEAERNARIAIEPVSYTHLDVYKRQVIGTSNRQDVLSRQRTARSITTRSEADCCATSIDSDAGTALKIDRATNLNGIVSYGFGVV